MIQETVLCPNCNAPLNIQILEAIIVNHIVISSVHYHHPRPDFCPACKRKYFPIIVNYQNIQFAWAEIPKQHQQQQQEEGRIKVPNLILPKDFKK